MYSTVDLRSLKKEIEAQRGGWWLVEPWEKNYLNLEEVEEH